MRGRRTICRPDNAPTSRMNLICLPIPSDADPMGWWEIVVTEQSGNKLPFGGTTPGRWQTKHGADDIGIPSFHPLGVCDVFRPMLVKHLL